MGPAVVTVNADAAGRTVGWRCATVSDIVSHQVKACTNAGKIVEPEVTLLNPGCPQEIEDL
jgi:hypothetical protein